MDGSDGDSLRDACFYLLETRQIFALNQRAAQPVIAGGLFDYPGKSYLMPSRKLLRRSWLLVHRVVGLVVGLVMIVMGLSGSYLVAHRLIGSDGKSPAKMDLSAYVGQPYADPEVMLEHLQSAMGSNMSLWRLNWPNENEAAFIAAVAEEESKRGEGKTIWGYVLHPYTGAVLGRRVLHTGMRNPHNTLSTWIFHLHDKLQIGKQGRAIVGITGIALCLSILSGIVLWWPKGSWKRAFRFVGKSRVRRWYDAHRLMGIVTAVFLLVPAITGLFFVYHDTTERMVFALFGGSKERPHYAMEPVDPEMKPLPLIQLADIAQGAMPEAPLWTLEFPGGRVDAGQPLSAYLKQEAEPAIGHASTRVWIDPYRGTILGIHDPLKDPLGNRMLTWVFPLHTGEAFGTVGSVLAFIAGLAPLFLFISGVIIWGAKRKGRQAAAA